MRFRNILAVALPIVVVSTLSLLFFSSPFAKGEPNYTETTTYFLTDHLGSIDVVMDDQGKVIERADYLPFGSDRLRITDINTSETDYKFTGKEKDNETGLMYYGARYYDSEIGRFISEDPWEGDLSDPQTLNKYAYVLNNPIKFVDPTGGKVELVGREVALPLLSFAMHTYLKITPDNPQDFGVENSFSFTLSGQMNNITDRKLVGEFNNTGDLNENGELKVHNTAVIEAPNGNDTQFINDILEAHSRSGNDQYSLTSSGDQYNCNNYSTSLLLGSGATVSFSDFDVKGVFENGLGETIPSMMNSANNGTNSGWRDDFNNKVIGPAIINDIITKAADTVKDAVKNLFSDKENE